MAINTTTAYLTQPFDCLLLVHPHIQVLENISNEIQGLGVVHLNISKELSHALIDVSARERSRFSQKWLIDRLALYQNGPVLCTCPDLLFDPSLEMDPLAFFRQAARMIQLIVMWPGEYASSILAYAIPEHHHFRTWKVSDSLLLQPVVMIQRI